MLLYGEDKTNLKKKLVSDPYYLDKKILKYQRRNQNPEIEEGQTTHGQQKRYKRTSNDLKNITHKTNY